MRKLIAIAGFALVVIAMTAWELYDFFVTNEGVSYYASDPRRLLYAALITALCGVGVWVFFRMSPGTRRGLKLLALGLSAGVFSALAAKSALTVLSFHSLLAEAGVDSWETIAPLVFLGAASAAAAVLLWFGFVHIWRKGVVRTV